MTVRLGPCEGRIYRATSTRGLALKRSCKHGIKQEEVTTTSLVRTGDFIRTAHHLEEIFCKRQFFFFLDKPYKLLIIFLFQVAPIQRERESVFIGALLLPFEKVYEFTGVHFSE